jgi:hypothetical protein
MKQVRGFPDVSFPLPIIKGFGVDDVAGPLKYTIKTDSVIRTVGRVLDDFSPGVLTGIGWGITVTPNLVKNIREKHPWNQTAADLIVDSGGFILGELAGWGAGVVAASLFPPAAPVAVLVAKVFVDGAVSIGWDYFAERYGWKDWLSERLQKGAKSFEQKLTDSMQQALDPVKYPPVPTPPPAPQITGTPAPSEQTPSNSSGIPVSKDNPPAAPVPTPPPAP